MRNLLFIIGFIFALTFTSCANRVVVTTPRARVIKVAPKHHKIVIIKGKRYYYWNGHHYRKTKKGYVVVRV
jgi:uncharacterized protein with PIN domain